MFKNVLNDTKDMNIIQFEEYKKIKKRCMTNLLEKLL
jgi:hypothetical protein